MQIDDAAVKRQKQGHCLIGNLACPQVRNVYHCDSLFGRSLYINDVIADARSQNDFALRQGFQHLSSVIGDSEVMMPSASRTDVMKLSRPHRA